MPNDIGTRPQTGLLVRFGLRLVGCVGLGFVAYLLLFLPQDAAISSLTSDKVGHLAVGFTLALSLHALFSGRHRLVVLAAAVAASALSEGLQQMVGRDAELGDFIADVAGAMAYVGLATLVLAFRRGERRARA